MVPVTRIKLLEVDGREEVECESWETDDHGNQKLVPDTEAILDPPQLIRQHRTADRQERQHDSIDRIKLFIKVR
jgi:hypothetical protein